MSQRSTKNSPRKSKEKLQPSSKSKSPSRRQIKGNSSIIQDYKFKTGVSPYVQAQVKEVPKKIEEIPLKKGLPLIKIPTPKNQPHKEFYKLAIKNPQAFQTNQITKKGIIQQKNEQRGNSLIFSDRDVSATYQTATPEHCRVTNARKRVMQNRQKDLSTGIQKGKKSFDGLMPSRKLRYIS